ncbi:type I-B CRISPR-associated protein Cas7/Cst2/DevR [Tepidibacter sp. Z1-5]|uniref:type I-B CRISPR-associated protein Cas7/Cst2/DevR n=1 Tax=Tepidibacter sp. Z1-5 TaxID=3134138 RepID=UPI0030BF12E5
MEFLNINYISKVNLASLNGSEGMGGNITPIKKVSDYEGNEFVYISGQAIRRYLKETLRELGQKISLVDEDGSPHFGDYHEQVFKKGKFNDKKVMFENFIDMDLFGYMFPNAGRRWSVVKVAPMLSLLPYKGEYDYLTRKQKVEDESKKSGNIVQVEIDTLNYMRGNIVVDLDKVGKDINEYTYDEISMIEDEKINERINVFIDSVKYLNGGAKQSRNLEDISPKFVVVLNQKVGNPFLLNTLSVDKNRNLNVDVIIEELKNNENVINNVKIGIDKNIFKNYEEVVRKFVEEGYEVLGVNKALDSLKKGDK